MSDTKIKSSNIGNLAVTHDKLHTTMDLTAKTVTIATPTANTHPATKLYVDTEVANLIDSAPGTLDTLNELAAAIGDDANFAATVTTGLSNKLPLAGGTMTGVIAGFESTGIDDNSSATAVTILSDGKVGIGTASPDEKLDVRGAVGVGYVNGGMLRLYNQAHSNYSSIRNTKLTAAGATANMQFHDSTGFVMLIEGGNVGIGTAGPDAKLHIDAIDDNGLIVQNSTS